MVTSYDVEFDAVTVAANIHRIVNQVYKLLPTNEEGKDWQKPLETVLNELIGMYNLLPDMKNTGLAVIAKLEGLKQQGSEVEFPLFRRTIFECCTLLSKIEKTIAPDED